MPQLKSRDDAPGIHRKRRLAVREANAMVGLYILFFSLMALLLAVMLFGVFTEGRHR